MYCYIGSDFTIFPKLSNNWPSIIYLNNLFFSHWIVMWLIAFTILSYILGSVSNLSFLFTILSVLVLVLYCFNDCNIHILLLGRVCDPSLVFFSNFFWLVKKSVRFSNLSRSPHTTHTKKIIMWFWLKLPKIHIFEKNASNKYLFLFIYSSGVLTPQVRQKFNLNVLFKKETGHFQWNKMNKGQEQKYSQ